MSGYNYFVIGTSMNSTRVKCSQCGCEKFKTTRYSGNAFKSIRYIECIECGDVCRLETDKDGTELISAHTDETIDNAREYGMQE